MTLNQRLKKIARIVREKGFREYKDENGKPTGKGYQYYPKELIPHLTHSDPNCEHCKNMLAENIAIQLNIMQNGGQYRPHNPKRS